jgi:hypothetical protein
MQLNLKGFCAIGTLSIGIFSITGCGVSNAKPSSASTTTQLTGSGTSGSSGSGSTTPTTPTSPSTPSTPTTPPPNNNGSAPAPPAGATIISNIQNQKGWQTCGGCGNEGGTGQGPIYDVTQGIASPALSGSSADFWITGGPAYSGGYYFIEQPTVPNPVSYLRYEFDLYIPAQYASAPQAIEFECQQNANGYTYNYAWQADYDSKTWRVFNYTTKHWEGTSVAFQPFAPDTWHHIIAMYHASGTQVIHDSITVDGVTYPVNITHDALFTGNGLELTNAFQVDLDGSSSPYHVYVDNMMVSLKD